MVSEMSTPAGGVRTPPNHTGRAITDMTATDQTDLSISPDGNWIWDGTAWVPTQPQPPMNSTTPTTAAEKPKPGKSKRGNGWALAALIIGIIAVAISWMPLINNLSPILSLAALVVGIAGIVRARRGAPGHGKAVAGVILSIAAFAITLGTQALMGAAIDSIDESINAPDNALAVTIGDPQSDSFATTVPVKIKNKSEEAITGGSVTVQAQDSDGTVIGDAYVSVPALEAGQSGKEEALFTEDLPADATFVVVEQDAWNF